MFLDEIGWIPGSAQGTIENMVNMDARIKFEHLIDFDGDGDLDGVFWDEKLNWYENTGQGEFQLSAEIETEELFDERGIIRDLDNDGLADLIYVGQETPSNDYGIFWQKQLPDLSFQSPVMTNYDFSNSSQIVLATEDNGGETFFYVDGLPEIIVFRFDSVTNALVLVNETTGIEGDQQFVDFDLCDLNLDGNLDIICYKNSSLILIFENIGNQTFDFIHEMYIPNLSNPDSHLRKFSHLDDVTSDSKDDFILRNGAYIAAKENLFSETFDFLIDPIDRMPTDDILIKYPLELNGDGKIDLVYSTPSGLSIQKSVYEQPRPSFFRNEASLPYQDYIADLDRNGSLELLGVKGNRFYIIDYDSYGNDFTQANFFFTYQEDEYVFFESLFSLDMDFDGDEDIISYEFNKKKLVIFENDGANNFSDPTIWRCDISITPLMFNDLNNDGILDFICTFSSSSYDRFDVNLSQSGNLDFETNSKTIDQPISDIQLMDVDGDGSADLIFDNLEENKYQWVKFENGDFDFSEKRLIFNELGNPYYSYAIFGLSSTPRKIEAFRYTDASPSKIEHFVFNEDNMEFEFTALVGSEIGKPLVTRDVDNDGDLDLYITGNNYQEATYIEQIDGSFLIGNSSFKFTRNFGIGGVFQRDLNFDGLMDYFDLEGTTSFGNSTQPDDFNTIIIPHNVLYHTIYYQDIDSDGDLDALSIYGHNFNYRENLGSNEFSEVRLLQEMPYSGVSSGGEPVFHDFDKNGLIDFLIPMESNMYKFMNKGNGFDTLAVQSEYKNLRYLKILELPLTGLVLLIGHDIDQNELNVYEYNTDIQDFDFRSKVAIPSNAGPFLVPQEIVAFDFDNDGSEEIIVNIYSGVVEYSTVIIDTDWSEKYTTRS